VIDIRFSPAAYQSILDQADYYRLTLDQDLVDRWELAVDLAINSLLSFPERGAPCRFRSPALAGLRWIFVPGFPKHMVFYRYLPQEQLLLIVKVAHGARNLETLLDEED
jgi:plasmid stabilization system protein ParE